MLERNKIILTGYPLFKKSVGFDRTPPLETKKRLCKNARSVALGNIL